MSMEKDITIFICENSKTTEEIITKYFKKNKVSFALNLPAKKRQEVVGKLDEILDD